MEANELSAGWEELGVSVRRLGLKELANEVRDGVTRVEDLPAEREPRRWLAQYFDLIGELPSDYDCSDLVDGLVPNQRGALCSSVALKRDAGISEFLKILQN